MRRRVLRDRLWLLCISVAQQMVSTAAFVTLTVTWTIPANGGEGDRAFVHQMTTYSDSRWCAEENMLTSSFKLIIYAQYAKLELGNCVKLCQKGVKKNLDS